MEKVSIIQTTKEIMNITYILVIIVMCQKKRIIVFRNKILQIFIMLMTFLKFSLKVRAKQYGDLERFKDDCNLIDL